MPMLNMMLGEVAPGGVGAGLYGMLVLAIIAVFIAGLLVGPHPRVPRQEDRRRARSSSRASTSSSRRRSCSLGTALSFAIPGVREDVETTSIWNPGVHGFSEVLYAFTSAANNNGSAFAGLTANTPWLNTALGVAMLLGRFLPIVFVLALAGSPRRAGQGARDRGHPAHPPAAVRRPPRRRDGHRDRPHLFPRSRAGSPGGRAELIHVHHHLELTGHTPRPMGSPSKRPMGGFGPAQLVAGPARRAAQARPARRCGATPSCSSSRSARRSRRCSRSPSRSSADRAISGGTECRRPSPGPSPSGSGSP